jgi:hypothetical protein
MPITLAEIAISLVDMTITLVEIAISLTVMTITLAGIVKGKLPFLLIHSLLIIYNGAPGTGRN